MADETTPTTPTAPVAPGATTSEFHLAKIAAYAGIVIAVLSAVSDAVLEITKIMPNPIITKIGVVAGLVATTLSTILYGQQRSALKQAALNAAPAAGDPAAVVKQ